jgi:KDO2-lipid IV(A) lauroyltransferase
MSKPKKKAEENRRWKSWFEYLLFRIFFGLVKLVPFRLGCWLGERLGILSYWVLGGRRHLTIKNIEEAKQHGYLKNVENPRRLAYRVWKNIGRVSSEFLYYYTRPMQRLKEDVIIEGTANLERVLEKKKGAIIVAAHIGNWEMLAMSIALHGYGLTTLVKTQSNKLMDGIIQGNRRSVGMEIVPRNLFLRPLVLALRKNHTVLFLVDQADRKGAVVDFFGRPAVLPRGAAEFALKTGTPVVFIYIAREAAHRHRLVISEEIKLPQSGNYTLDSQETVTLFIKRIESIIEKYPDQWLWMHRLWGKEPKKRKPRP